MLMGLEKSPRRVVRTLVGVEDYLGLLLFFSASQIPQRARQS